MFCFHIMETSPTWNLASIMSVYGWRSDSVFPNLETFKQSNALSKFLIKPSVSSFLVSPVYQATPLHLLPSCLKPKNMELLQKQTWFSLYLYNRVNFNVTYLVFGGFDEVLNPGRILSKILTKTTRDISLWIK